MYKLMVFNKDVDEDTLRPGDTIILYSYPLQRVLLYYACARDGDGKLTLKFYDIHNKEQDYLLDNLIGCKYVKLLPNQHLPVIKAGDSYRFENI